MRSTPTDNTMHNTPIEYRTNLAVKLYKFCKSLLTFKTSRWSSRQQLLTAKSEQWQQRVRSATAERRRQLRLLILLSTTSSIIIIINPYRAVTRLLALMVKQSTNRALSGAISPFSSTSHRLVPLSCILLCGYKKIKVLSI